MSRDVQLKVHGDALTHFVICATLSEARRVLPELTKEQFAGIKAGRLVIEGNSVDGVRLKEVHP